MLIQFSFFAAMSSRSGEAEEKETGNRDRDNGGADGHVIASGNKGELKR